MILANELRIGNFINFKNNLQEGQDNRIKSCDFVVIERSPNSVLPIPLTEKWLLDFGFVQYSDEWVKGYKKDRILIGEDFDFYNGIFTQPIESVHQLQNIYFALTGKELELCK